MKAFCSMLCCFALLGAMRGFALDETAPLYQTTSGEQSGSATPSTATGGTPGAPVADGATSTPNSTQKKHHKHKKVADGAAAAGAAKTGVAPTTGAPVKTATAKSSTAGAKVAAKSTGKVSKSGLAQKAAKKTGTSVKAGVLAASTSTLAPKLSPTGQQPGVSPLSSASTSPTSDLTPAASPTAPILSTIDISPVVETGLPVARHGAATVTYPGSGAGRSNTAVNNAFLTGLPPSALPTAAPGLFNGTGYAHRTAPDPFVFADFSRHHTSYPWHKDIVTTIFWIGEGASGYNSTTNHASCWDDNWTGRNRGVDTPNDRAFYSPGSHAFTMNTFYFALPFNDLAYPDKARRWLPGSWSRAPQNGHAVSACKDRWVRIKNRQGDYCYAQWEDAGPYDADHAEYVFGDERPNTPNGGAGLDISPAVAQYLNIDGNNRYTSWSFVDAIDVPHGPWLTYDELATVMDALLQLKNKPHPLPIQKTEAPLPDQTTIETSLKKVGAAKG